MLDQSEYQISDNENLVHHGILDIVESNPGYFANYAAQYAVGSDAKDFLNDLADSVLSDFFPDVSLDSGNTEETRRLRDSIIGGLISHYIDSSTLGVFSTEHGTETELFDSEEFALVLIQSLIEGVGVSEDLNDDSDDATIEG